MSRAPALIEVKNLEVHFPTRKGSFWTGKGDPIRAVDGVNLAIRKGETLGLVGESGCGKSTLARAILQLQIPTSGSVLFDGNDLTRMSGTRLRKLRSRIQIVFQDPHASLNPRKTIGAMLLEPIRLHRISDRRAALQRAQELVDIVGLPSDALKRYPHEFSGGQRQRAGIARALAVEPDFIAADEAVSALDVSIRAQIINLLYDLQQQLQLTYLFIAHDLSVVRHISDRIAVMYLGVVTEVAPSLDLYEMPLHPYTVALISAVPIPDPTVELTRQRMILPGDVPSPASPPPGCRFNTRCWLKQELGNPARCVEEVPALREIRPDHFSACHFAEKLLVPQGLAQPQGQDS